MTLTLPADEFEFAGQLVHAALPEEFLYVPEGHTVHCPLEAPVSGPVYPVLHGHTIVERPQVGGIPYTSTSASCSGPDVAFDILTYFPIPLHTCVLDHGATIAPFCPVAQFAKVIPSFESCIWKFTSLSVFQQSRFQIFSDLIVSARCKSTCHHCVVNASFPMKVIQSFSSPTPLFANSGA